MADFRDGKATMDTGSGFTPDWRPRKTGLKRAENGDNGGDGGNGDPAGLAPPVPRRKAIAVMEAGAMDNGEAACPLASRARKTGQTSIWARFANRWTRWSEPRNLERCRVS